LLSLLQRNSKQEDKLEILSLLDYIDNLQASTSLSTGKQEVDYAYHKTMAQVFSHLGVFCLCTTPKNIPSFDR
jgi:hypothetical protein